MTGSAPDKVLIIASNTGLYPALLLADGARTHDIAADILFSGDSVAAVVTTNLDEATEAMLNEFTNAGGYVYAEQAALDAASLGRSDLWPGVKDVLPIEQFQHHASEHTLVVTL